MDYRQELLQQIETYFTDVITPYKQTTTGAMQDARKLGLFKKRDFSGHISAFEKHKEAAEGVDISGIEISPGDVKAKLLADQFMRSRRSFMLLCEENMRFYEVTEKKQYRGSGVTVKQYTESFNKMQEVLKEAVTELDLLEKEYTEYARDNASEE
ncbi:MAG: hypothetical protein ACI4LA_06200 [Emergencia sp.]